jgi:flagellar basal-body rod protein FlgB
VGLFPDLEFPMAVDPLFGLHPAALAVQRKRMDVLAANIANSDTPNFQARDIDFAATLSQLQAQGSAQALSATDAQHLNASGHAAGGGLDAELVWRVPMQNSVDGNTVDTQIEQAKFADASLHYQASLNFIDGRVKSMLTAITGQ